MFGTIRRHQKWLWIVISTVTIISFVAFFSPQRRRQAGWSGPRDYIGSINGRQITSGEYTAAMREAELRYLFNYGDWPGNQASVVEREVQGRLLLLEKLRDLDVQVGEPAVAQWILDNPAFHDPKDKRFNKDGYDHFVSNILPTRGLSKSDFERFARHEVGIQHLAALAGTAGRLITPQEAEALFRRQNEEAEAEAVFISSSNYVAQVQVDPAAVATYFTNQQAVYRIPERTQVAYVKFATSNYLAEADQVLQKNPLLLTNALKEATAATADKVRDQLRDTVAMQEAKKKAVEFANELFELKDKTDGLEKLAAAKGLVSEVTEPFTQFEIPKGMKVPRSFSQAAAKLTPDEPVAEQPVQGEDGIYIFELKKRIPSEIPPLDAVREKVVRDYQNSEAMKLARAAGRDLRTAVTNEMAQGKTFDVAVADKNASPIVLPPFSRKTTSLPGLPSPSEASQVIDRTFGLSPGKVSDFVPTSTGGFLVYLKAITPVSEAKLKSDLPEFTAKLRQSRQYEAFADWFRTQERLAQINLPGEKQRASAK